MTSFSWNPNNTSNSFYPYSSDNKSNNQSKNIQKFIFPKKNDSSRQNSIYNFEYKNNSFNSIVKYVHKYFISFYKNEDNDYNIRMIENILNNEDTHLVAEFKDFLIMGDIHEFLQKYYKLFESKKYLPKICDYYINSSVIFPNYVVLQENKYIYKNIRKKQKLIDNQQEQEDIKEKNLKKNSSADTLDNFFSSKTLNSILQQTNTSNVKVIFGIDEHKNNMNNENKNSIDKNETANKIIQNFEKIEKEVINIKSEISNNIYNNNKHIYKNNDLFKINNSSVNSNINLNTSINNKNHKKKRVINSYLSKKQLMTENNSKNNNDSNSSLLGKFGKESDYIQKKYFNFLINSQKNNKRKLFIENSLSRNNNKNYFIKRMNHSNRSIKVSKNMNTLIPSKACISNFFINNSSRSVLKYNSFNFISKNIENKSNNNFYFSPIHNTIQVNPFKKKYYYNLNININNSNSSKKMISKILNSNSNEYIFDNEKIKKQKNKNRNNTYKQKHNHTVSLSLKIINNKNNQNNKSKTKQNNREKNYYNNPQIRTNNLRTIANSVNNKNILDKIINKKKNNINTYYIKSKKNNNHLNHLKKKNLNFQKINSLSNIKKTIKEDTLNKKIKKLFFNQKSRENIFNNKIFPISPLSIKFESLKTPLTKKELNSKSKKIKNNIYTNININNNILFKEKNYNGDSLINSPNKSNNNNGVKNKLIIEELNKKKSIMFPLKKEINIINININGYNNNEKGWMTSRESNSKPKRKQLYNQDMKLKDKNKNKKSNKVNNNFLSRNEKKNPVIIKGINSGFLTTRK